MYALSSSFVINLLRRDNRGLTRDFNSSRKLVKDLFMSGILGGNLNLKIFLFYFCILKLFKITRKDFKH